MKKTILLSFILFASFSGICQNLKFSQILLVNSLQTVPSGKAWKVEKIMTSASIADAQQGNTCFKVSINGASYFLNSNVAASGSGTSQYIPGCSDGPLWLPAGTTITTQCPSSVLSVIEFDNVP